MKTNLRSHNCGELKEKDIKKQVKLCGWCDTRRDHGGIIFIDLRDRFGIIQIVFDPKNKGLFKEADKLRREDCISIKGKVRKRPKGMENKKIKTGKIEILVSDLEIISKSKVPPFEIDDRIEVNEDLRLKYRYLDLRKPSMQKNLEKRHEIIKVIHEYLNKKKFIQIETPFLTKSTPEGARDYLVPSRTHPGKFFALPQSPQIFKQILMISNFDRYYQIVKCFRDEDLRADRQPEFTQLDIEMSFVNEEDIYNLCEELMKEIFSKVLKKKIKTPFKRMGYWDVIDKYGCDNPDLRFGLELINVDSIVKKSDFEVFKKSELVKCISLEKELTRKDLDYLTGWAIKNGAKGLAWIKISKGEMEGNILKYINKKVQNELLKKVKIKNGVLFFVADRKETVNEVLGRLRIKLAKKYDLIKEGWEFLWVTEFPLLEYSEEEERYVSVHHPFTMPYEEDLKFLDKNPGKVRSRGYDLVLNGVELGGGSIRIHKKDIQDRMFKALGISKEEAKIKFGFLLDALDYGAPIHGGIAFGLDRLCAMLTGNESIREVIAFPKNKAAEDVMSNAPSEVNDKQLKELNIKVDLENK